MKLPQLHLLTFLREVFSEDGQGSFSRVAQGAIVLGVLSWVTYLVVHTHAMPDLGGPSLFIGTGAGGHYLVNKIPDILSAAKGNSGVPPVPPPPPAGVVQQ